MKKELKYPSQHKQFTLRNRKILSVLNYELHKTGF